MLETGEREQLSPMTPFERKIVHDAVAAVDGVRSESEGVEPSRRVVVLRRLTELHGCSSSPRGSAARRSGGCFT